MYKGWLYYCAILVPAGYQGATEDVPGWQHGLATPYTNIHNYGRATNT